MSASYFLRESLEAFETMGVVLRPGNDDQVMTALVESGVVEMRDGRYRLVRPSDADDQSKS